MASAEESLAQLVGLTGSKAAGDPLRLTPKRLFLLFGLAFGLIVIGFRAQLLWSEHDQLLQQRTAQAAALARFGSTYSARIYDSSSRMASEFADFMREKHPSQEQLSAYLRSRTQNTTSNAYAVVLGPDGRLSASSEPAPIGKNYGSPDFAQRFANANRQIEPAVRSQLTGAVIYPLTQTLQDRNGAFAGLVSINARPDGIRPLEARRPEDPQLSIWTLDGRFIAAAFMDFDANGRAIPPPKPAGLGLPGSRATPDPGVIQASTALEGWPLIAVAQYDRAGVLTIWRRHIVENIGLVVLLLSGVSLLVWLGMRTAEREEIAKSSYLVAQETAMRALQDRELLLKEIHHRIKNSLLLTSSLIYLQSREFRDPEVKAAFESTQRRLSSVGLVHDALYSGKDLARVDLSTYLDKLIREVAASFGAEKRGVELDVEIEPISISADRAMPVALILTEVLTNAFKYAFRDRTEGRLSVEGRRLGPEVEIVVCDDGPGIDHAEVEGSGLGARMIRSLSDQIDGRYRFEDAQGLRFVLSFPAVGAFETLSSS
jgi:two-component sensor histidine kinase